MGLLDFWKSQLLSISDALEQVKDQESLLRVRLASGENIAADTEEVRTAKRQLEKQAEAILNEIKLAEATEKPKEE